MATVGSATSSLVPGAEEEETDGEGGGVGGSSEVPGLGDADAFQVMNGPGDGRGVGRRSSMAEAAAAHEEDEDAAAGFTTARKVPGGAGTGAVVGAGGLPEPSFPEGWSSEGRPPLDLVESEAARGLFVRFLQEEGDRLAEGAGGVAGNRGGSGSRSTRRVGTAATSASAGTAGGGGGGGGGGGRVLAPRERDALVQKHVSGRFVLDLGAAHRGSGRRSKKVVVINAGGRAGGVSADTGRMAELGMRLEPGKVNRLAPGESAPLAVAYQVPRRAKLGLHEIEVALTTPGGPTAVMVVRLHVTEPALQLYPRVLDFGSIPLEHERIEPMLLLNPTPLPVQWERGHLTTLSADKKADEELFQLEPAGGGIVPANGASLVKIRFQPQARLASGRGAALVGLCLRLRPVGAPAGANSALPKQLTPPKELVHRRAQDAAENAGVTLLSGQREATPLVASPSVWLWGATQMLQVQVYPPRIGLGHVLPCGGRRTVTDSSGAQGEDEDVDKNGARSAQGQGQGLFAAHAVVSLRNPSDTQWMEVAAP